MVYSLIQSTSYSKTIFLISLTNLILKRICHDLSNNNLHSSAILRSTKKLSISTREQMHSHLVYLFLFYFTNAHLCVHFFRANIIHVMTCKMKLSSLSAKRLNREHADITKRWLCAKTIFHKIKLENTASTFFNTWCKFVVHERLLYSSKEIGIRETKKKNVNFSVIS